MEFKDWIVNEVRLEKLRRFFQPNSVFGILSAELRQDQTPHPETGQIFNKSISKKERASKTNLLRQVLSGENKIDGYSGKVYKFHQAKGVWPTGPEKSFVVNSIDFADLLFLARFFNQEAFIYKSADNPAPIMYFIRGEMGNSAYPAHGVQYGYSQALAPRGKRSTPDWAPDRPEWEKEVQSSGIDMKDMMGTAADRFPVNFGDTGFNLQFDFNLKMPFHGEEITFNRMKYLLGQRDADYLAAFFAPQRVGKAG